MNKNSLSYSLALVVTTILLSLLGLEILILALSKNQWFLLLVAGFAGLLVSIFLISSLKEEFATG